MSNDTILTDDAVAELLAKEASEASIKYSSMGLDAFKSQKKPANTAKPNTRFLSRIIKETTNHNAALLAKEKSEARARLEDLTEAEESKRRKLCPSAGDVRRRQLGDISAILRGSKRRHEPDSEVKKQSAETASAREKHDNRHAREDKDSKRDGRRHGDEDLKKDSRHRHRSRRDGEHDKEHDRERRRHRHRSRSPDHSSSRRKYRERSPVSDEDRGSSKRHADSKSRTERSRRKDDDDVSLKRKRDGRLTRDGGEDQKDHDLNRPSKLQRLSEMYEKEKAEDSDPLDEFIGPAPPVRPRGRGRVGAQVLKGDYDSIADFDDESDRLDSNDEIEAYRDRQKLKQRRAERLRAAGFTEEQIKAGLEGKKPPEAEKNPEDVKWNKRGQQRSWDEGKEEVLYDDDD
ncbi:hypothetical protein V8F20_000841 [Naviculisporaceae sp. PSN 640]